MTRLELVTIGDSEGVILPRELLSRLRIKAGDHLLMLETENGIELSAYDPEFDRQMEIAEQVMREDRDALRELAK